MSLTDWVDWDKDFLNVLFDKPKLDVNGELKAPPLTKNYSTVGTAFDYAMRFMINRENDMMRGDDLRSGGINAYSEEGRWVAYRSLESNNNKRRQNFLKIIEQKHGEYIRGNISIFELLPDCITLAKLDSIFRSGKDFPDSDIFSVNLDDVKDLTNLVNIINISQFKAKRRCLLNPTFGKSSEDIGGADADLVIDDCLIDIKTTKYLEFTREQFRQLMGYYLLNLRENSILGQINYLGLYFSRYGILFKFDASSIYAEGVEYHGAYRELHGEWHQHFIEPDTDLFKFTPEFLYPQDAKAFGCFFKKHPNLFNSDSEIMHTIMVWEEIEDSIEQYQSALKG